MTSAGIDLLLVEDNPDDARFVERSIREWESARIAERRRAPIGSVSITHATRLADGLERLRSDGPDVVLLDLMLPDSSGMETVEAMIERAPTVPIVVLTGRNDADVGAEAIRTGAQDYLVKGTITAELLLRTLRYAIERARTQRKLVDRNHRLALLNRIVRTDIRNDVSMIVGRADQLEDLIDPAGEPALTGLLEASRHALELTDTAAEVMDLLSRDLAETPKPCDLLAILDDEVERLRRGESVEISVERFDGETDSLTVAASPMLGSVFEQLLSNAVVHTDRPVPEVTVTVESTDELAIVSIADDGVGIPDGQKALLTDPESRFDESALGAGLYLVTSVLEEFGGTLEIEDHYPRGTIVSVTLERIPPE